MDAFLFSPVSTISVLAGVLSAEPPVRTSELLSLRAPMGEPSGAKQSFATVDKIVSSGKERSPRSNYVDC